MTVAALELVMEKPSTLGFHCDGDCWKDFGQAPALIAHLEEKSLEARDAFVTAAWASEIPAARHPLPPMSEVHPIQDYVAMAAVEKYLAGEKPATQEFYETHPTLFLLQGKYYIFQGTHRLAALYEQGATTYEGWLLEL